MTMPWYELIHTKVADTLTIRCQTCGLVCLVMLTNIVGGKEMTHTFRMPAQCPECSGELKRRDEDGS